MGVSTYCTLVADGQTIRRRATANDAWPTVRRTQVLLTAVSRHVHMLHDQLEPRATQLRFLQCRLASIAQLSVARDL